MGHKNRKTLIRQVQEALESKLAIGQSRHKAKQAGTDKEHIYSWNTFRTYQKHACYFVKWCKENHGCKTLAECRPHADEWLQSRFHLSPYTITMERSSLAKLYGEPGENFVEVPKRHRSDIKRSRGTAKRDKHFSTERNADIISFCRSTGLRRAELALVTGDCYFEQNGKSYLRVTRGTKGGRPRTVPVIGNVDLVRDLCGAAGTGKVFPHVPGMMDIHAYRAKYATALYEIVARSVSDIPYDKVAANGRRYQSGVYICRRDRKGERFDKLAMKVVSQALGHNRISVIAEHYLRLD